MSVSPPLVVSATLRPDLEEEDMSDEVEVIRAGVSKMSSDSVSQDSTSRSSDLSRFVN